MRPVNLLRACAGRVGEPMPHHGLMTRKYDDVDWHDGAAMEAGQPPEQGFVHIGFYLGWVLKRGLHDPAAIPAEHVAAVLDGSMTGSDLRDDVDGRLVADMLSDEGRAFTDQAYDWYLDAYGGRSSPNLSTASRTRRRTRHVPNGSSTRPTRSGVPAGRSNPSSKSLQAGSRCRRRVPTHRWRCGMSKPTRRRSHPTRTPSPARPVRRDRGALPNSSGSSSIGSVLRRGRCLPCPRASGARRT